MSGKQFRVYVEKDKETGLYAARCLEMSVFSQGKTEQETLKNIRKAIRLHLGVISDELRGKRLIEVEV